MKWQPFGQVWLRWGMCCIYSARVHYSIIRASQRRSSPTRGSPSMMYWFTSNCLSVFNACMQTPYGFIHTHGLLRYKWLDLIWLSRPSVAFRLNSGTLFQVTLLRFCIRFEIRSDIIFVPIFFSCYLLISAVFYWVHSGNSTYSPMVFWSVSLLKKLKLHSGHKKKETYSSSK